MRKELEIIERFITGNGESDRAAYINACATVVNNRDKLAHPVFILLPGGLTGNDDADWFLVKEGSVELCNCGNERLIMPETLRENFVEAEDSEVTLLPGQSVFIKPAGSFDIDAYIALTMTPEEASEASVQVSQWPNHPMNIGGATDLVFPSGVTLANLVEPLDGDGSLTLFVPKSGSKIPVCRWVAADPEAGTLTIDLDEGVELVDVTAG